MYEPSLRRVARDGLDLIVDPDAADVGIRVAFTDRHAGTSADPYRSLNLGRATGDDTTHVAMNRERVYRALGIEGDLVHYVRQVHGTHVVQRDGRVTSGPLEEADGIALTTPAAAAVLTVDCVPIVIHGERRTVALHAGWRGLAAGAVAAAVARAGPTAVAWVGPSIRGCCYEVGEDVVDAFRRAGLPVADANHVDPGAAASHALRAAGVDAIAVWDECTSCTTADIPGEPPWRFFSYRRDGVTGRQCGIVAVIA